MNTSYNNIMQTAATTATVETPTMKATAEAATAETPTTATAAEAT